MKNLLLILFPLAIGCATKYPVPSATAEKQESSVESDGNQPAWVLNKPTSSQYYHGVGNAPLRDPNYQQAAKLEALEDLASEISIQIESTSLLNQIETNSSFKESYRSSIISKTKQEIEDFELVETWSDQYQYWTYYRLNKSSYAEKREVMRRQAMELAIDHFKRANDQYEGGLFVQSMQSFSQVLEDLKLYLNESNSATINGNQYLLANESIHRIRNILSQIKLTTENLHITLTDNTEDVIIEVNYENKPVNGLPLILTNELDEKISSDLGRISTQINRKNHSNRLIVETSLSFLKNYDIAYQLLSDLPLSRIEIQLEARPLSFSINSEETNLGQELQNKQLAPFFEKVLTESGSLISQNQPDYILEAIGSTRKGSEISGLFSAFLTIHIAVKNSKGEALYQDTFDEVKGLNISYEKAGITAYQNVPKELEASIKKSLNEKFFQRNK